MVTLVIPGKGKSMADTASGKKGKTNPQRLAILIPLRRTNLLSSVTENLRKQRAARGDLVGTPIWMETPDKPWSTALGGAIRVSKSGFFETALRI